jgi:hypothetical protein
LFATVEAVTNMVWEGDNDIMDKGFVWGLQWLKTGKLSIPERGEL